MLSPSRPSTDARSTALAKMVLRVCSERRLETRATRLLWHDRSICRNSTIVLSVGQRSSSRLGDLHWLSAVSRVERVHPLFSGRAPYVGPASGDGAVTGVGTGVAEPAAGKGAVTGRPADSSRRPRAARPPEHPGGGQTCGFTRTARCGFARAARLRFTKAACRAWSPSGSPPARESGALRVREGHPPNCVEARREDPGFGGPRGFVYKRPRP